MNIDAVAEAMCAADTLAIGWDMQDVDGKARFRRMAQAAIDALGLTEQQWTWSWPEHLTGTGEPGYGFICASREEARAEADDWMDIVHRYATPWVTTEGDA